MHNTLEKVGSKCGNDRAWQYSAHFPTDIDERSLHTYTSKQSFHLPYVMKGEDWGCMIFEACMLTCERMRSRKPGYPFLAAIHIVQFPLRDSIHHLRHQDKVMQVPSTACFTLKVTHVLWKPEGHKLYKWITMYRYELESSTAGCTRMKPDTYISMYRGGFFPVVWLLRVNRSPDLLVISAYQFGLSCSLYNAQTCRSE